MSMVVGNGTSTGYNTKYQYWIRIQVLYRLRSDIPIQLNGINLTELLPGHLHTKAVCYVIVKISEVNYARFYKSKSLGGRKYH